MSPIVGSILLIAILVVLAGVVVVFTTSLSGSLNAGAPGAAFETRETADGVVITHTSGDPIETEQLSLIVGEETQAAREFVAGGTVTAGTEIGPVDAENASDIDLVWDGGDESYVLYSTSGETTPDSPPETEPATETETPTPTPTPDPSDVVQPVESAGIDTQSGQIALTVENDGSETVTVVAVAVDATPIGDGVWIDDGNDPEFRTNGATDDGWVNDTDRKEESIAADGTEHSLETAGREPIELAATDGDVSATFRAFGPDDGWIEDSDDLAFADDEADADVTITFETADGRTSRIHLRIDGG